MKTIETTVYTFDELSDEAKEKARQWFLQDGDESQIAYDDTKEDAKNIGLIIEYLDDRRANKGEFEDDAISCAQSIISEHGDTCETYKTAKSFLQSVDSLNIEYPEDAEGYRGEKYDDEKEELEKEFLHALLEDYRVMYNQDYEYRCSNESVDENIEANEYTFTESGKRFG